MTWEAQLWRVVCGRSTGTPAKQSFILAPKSGKWYNEFLYSLLRQFSILITNKDSVIMEINGIQK